MKENFLISVIAPMYNEALGIADFIQKTTEVLDYHFKRYELILVDDCSTDDTAQVCLCYCKNNPNIQLISLSRNYGHEIASTAGLEHAKGDYIVLMDSDLQHPPEIIPGMLALAQENCDIDVVCGEKVNKVQDTWVTKKLKPWFYRIASWMTGFNLSGKVGNFRLMKRPVVDALIQMRETSRHLVLMFEHLGYETITIPYYCPPRQKGESKYNLLKLINLSIDSIVNFSSHPLRLISIMSFAVSFLMMMYASFILFQKLFTNQQLMDGQASIILLISGLFSILFIFLAIISEYISRIMLEVKKRPLYHVKRIYAYKKNAIDNELIY